MEDKKCVQKVGTQMSYGPDYIEGCGKPAVAVDTNGRPLCQKHYNKWLAKTMRNETAKKITTTQSNVAPQAEQPERESGKL